MKTFCQQGSAVLIVVLVLSALTVWCLNTLQTISFSTQAACVRQEREQLYCIAQGVMRYGVWLCSQRFATIAERAAAGTTSFDCPVGTWKIVERGPVLTGKIHGEFNNKTVALRAMVFDAAQKEVFAVSCTLVLTQESDQGQSQPVFCIRHWNRHA